MSNSIRYYYPWESWLKRKRKFLIRYGVDFDVDPQVMSQQIRNKAYHSGMKVSIHRIDDDLQVQFRKG